LYREEEGGGGGGERVVHGMDGTEQGVGRRNEEREI
jgi:hypothetical protein